MYYIVDVRSKGDCTIRLCLKLEGLTVHYRGKKFRGLTSLDENHTV